MMMEIAISNHVNEIVSVQLRAALGSHVLYKRASPNPIKVTNKREIAMFMAGSLDRKLYYDIELKTPNWSVGTDLLNRLFGMPRQTVDIPSDPYRPIFALPSDRLVAMAPPKKDPT